MASATRADVVAAAAPQVDEPDWLSEARDRAKEAGSGLELPTQKQKGWEFTDLSEFDLNGYTDAVATVEGLERSDEGAIVIVATSAGSSPPTTRSRPATRPAGATDCWSTCPRTRAPRRR